MIKILFVCGMNKRRSPTAEKIYHGDERVITRSAGVSDSSRTKLSEKNIEWADLILVMERKYKQRIQERFRGKSLPQIEILEIPDTYDYMDEELIGLIKSGTEPYLRRSSAT